MIYSLRNFALILLLTVYVSGFARGPEPARNAVLDLRTHSFKEKDIIQLAGDWAFYWEDFKLPSEFKKGKIPEPTLFGEVPSYWGDYSSDSLKFPGNGYASYFLRILLPEDMDRNLALAVPVFDASAVLFINGEKSFENGLPGISESTSSPGYNPETIIWKPDADTLDLLVHVSNFHHRRGGFWKGIKIGDSERMLERDERYHLLLHISLGILLAFSLFFFFFFIFYRKDRVQLSFSVALIGIFTRLICTDLFSIQVLFDISWDWIIRLEYLGTYLAFGSGLWFLYRLFPVRYMIWVTRILTILLGIMGLIVFFTKVKVFACTMLFFQPVVLLVLVFYVFACTWTVIKGKRVYLFFLAALILLVGTFVHDLMISHSMSGSSGSYTIHFALQLFVFIQSVLIIKTWTNAFKERVKLIDEIEFINRNLEGLVEKRTKELNRRNDEIRKKNEDIEDSNRELTEALEFKNRVFSIIAHDLKGPIASLVQNSALLEGDLTPEQNKILKDSFRDQSRSALSLIDNLLYWGRSQGSRMAFHPGLMEIKPILKDVIKPFIEIAHQKNIELILSAGEHSFVFADRELLEIICRNILSNALKFTGRSGKVNVSATPIAEEKMLEIRVSDNGSGIPEDRLIKILERNDMISTAGTEREKGTGLGLKLCQELVGVNNGKFHIESIPGQGTTVVIKLPGTPPV